MILEVIDSGKATGKVIVDTTPIHSNTSREINKTLMDAGIIYVAGKKSVHP
jgi:hypothetical protein